MTGKATFSEDEWTRLKRAPFIAGMAISFADPGGPIEVVKETSAVLKVIQGSSGEGRDDVVGHVADEILAMAMDRLAAVATVAIRSASRSAPLRVLPAAASNTSQVRPPVSLPVSQFMNRVQ